MKGYHMKRARMLVMLAGSTAPILAADVTDVKLSTLEEGPPPECEQESGLGTLECGVVTVDKKQRRNIELDMLALALTAPGHEPSMYQLRVLDSVMDAPWQLPKLHREKSWLIGAKQGKGVKAQQRAAQKKRNKRRRK